MLVTRVLTEAHRRTGTVLAAFLVLLLVAAACSDRKAGIQLTDIDATAVPTVMPDSASTSDPATAPTPDASDASVLADGSFVEVLLPVIKPIELPSLSKLGETGDLVEGSLGSLVASPITGVEVVAASCAADGGELLYGNNGDDVFESDGSGRIIEESDDGLTTLVVEADGSGEFYDESDNALLTIRVEADGAGEFYDKTGTRLTTIRVLSDGSGEFFREVGETLLTIKIAPDGSGQYFDQRAGQLLTVDAQADGSGEYFFDTEERKITIRVEPDGSWQLTDQGLDQRIELIVESDGSGTYVRRAFDSVVFEFDPSGDGTDVNGDPVSLRIPATPVFVVADEFPPLGKFGALAPPCATIIRFDSQLLFGFGESTVRPDAAETLDQVVRALNEIGKPIEVNGHTDSKGSDSANEALSLERANAVLAELERRRLDVDVEVNGFGESLPIAPNEIDGNDNPLGRAQNRRVEIVIRD